MASVIEIAEVFRRFASAYQAAHGTSMLRAGAAGAMGWRGRRHGLARPAPWAGAIEQRLRVITRGPPKASTTVA